MWELHEGIVILLVIIIVATIIKEITSLILRVIIVGVLCIFVIYMFMIREPMYVEIADTINFINILN